MYNMDNVAISGLPEPGQLVEIRRKLCVATDIQTSGSVDTKMMGYTGVPTHLVTVSSLEDDGFGEELQVVWELEPSKRVFERSNLPDVSGFDKPNHLDAFLNAVRWGTISFADMRSLQSPFRSGIDIEEYQLDPVVRALRMPRANLLIADDVGLGKTIETGLVAQELVLRHRVRTIIVVCPSSLQIQWATQMRDKFGLDFRIIDSDFMKKLRRNRGLHTNPWTHFPRLITSIDFLKRDRSMRLFREALPSEGEAIYPRRYDLLIVDEAHNVAPSGRGRYTLDSQRTQAIRRLVPHFEHKLFLTATPHNGYSESFTALLELLDSQRFARGVMPDRKQLETVMVRRMKSELELRWDGTRRFATRVIEAIEVGYTATERDAHRSLRDYASSRQNSFGNESERLATEFVLKLLKKRLFSSPPAFATTLEKHIQSIALAKRRNIVNVSSSSGILRRALEGIEEDFADDESFEETTAEALSVAGRLFHEPSQEERRLLDKLSEYAKSASSIPDSKASRLIAWLKEYIFKSGQWSNTRVLIFTEYRATQKWLNGLLAAEGLATQGRLMLLYGGMDSDEREKIKAAFQTDPNISPIRILLATDAASEGIDLQNYCSNVIHYEIPWNPNRLEQRNGRLDRHGQKADKVSVYHFVTKGFSKLTSQAEPGELEGDLEFLRKAVMKVETIREDIGKVGPVIAAQVEEAMLGKRRELDTRQAEREAEPVRKMLKFERELKKQLEELHSQLLESKRELHINPENVQKIVEIGLALAGQPNIKESTLTGVWPDPKNQRKSCPVFQLPAFSGSWAKCSEGLAHPHTGVIRPIVFDHSLMNGRDDVVLAHLNHRLVQMCLRLLRAEIWSQGPAKRLHRVSARITSDNALGAPSIVAHGRIVVLSGDNQRLHEEVIVSGGVLKEGRFSRLNVGEINTALEAALDEEAPESIKKRLQAIWPNISGPLLQSLEARMQDRTKGLQKTLDERSVKEIADMTAILQELERSIREQLGKPSEQLELFSSLEKEQYQADRNSLQRRLQQIPNEIKQETEILGARYRDPKPRLFPVSVTFLIPRRFTGEWQ